VLSPSDNGPEFVSIPIILEINGRILPDCTKDSGAKTSIRKQVCSERDQDRVTIFRSATSNIRNCQVVRQMARADDFDAVIKDE
jgi:hypothetical protein